jgi:multiple antibiotic resistance protein
MESFLLVFIPLFVAIDPVGTIPLFLSMTEGFTVQEKRKLAFQGVLTAFIVGVTFAAAGHYLFKLLGITAIDFKIAGGLLLLIFSIREIFGQTSKKTQGSTEDAFTGIVPLGIPLIAGPATITTLLILHDEFGFGLILLGLTANLVLTYLTYTFSDAIISKTGGAAYKVFAKVVGIVLAAIAVMMIRKGLEGWIPFIKG